MDEDNKVVAETRETFGKGAARKIRAAGKIPAVLYGHGTDPRHLTLPGHQILLLVRKANAVLELQIGSKTELALVKDVQKDPVHQIIEHLDLIVVKRGEKVQVEVPVHVEGEPESGTIADLDATTLSLEVEATHIPENVVVSVEGLEVRYGPVAVVCDLSLSVGAGEVVGLIGPNGAGKTTTLSAIMGLVGVKGGSVRLRDRSLVGRRPEDIARTGVALVPEGRHLFPAMTVEENLRLGLSGRRSLDGLDEDRAWIEGLFPTVRDFANRAAIHNKPATIAMATRLVASTAVTLT